MRSRKSIPILLPFVEIPYIGSFVSFPAAGAKEYHRSTAVMSAVVVPTAADLANGLEFSADRVLMSGYDKFNPTKCATPSCPSTGVAPCDKDTCDLRKARSISDLEGAPIREYNKRMVRCFADPTGCQCSLTFEKVLKGE